MRPRMHHIGIATRDAAATREQLSAVLGYRTISERVYDPLQRVHVQFLALTHDTEVLVELVEPAGEDSPIWRYLQEGAGFYHICFEVDDLDGAVRHARDNRALVVQQPVSAVAYGGRRIAWCYTASRQLIEFLERA